MFWNSPQQSDGQPRDARSDPASQPHDAQPGGSTPASQQTSRQPEGFETLTPEEKLSRAELVREKTGVTFEEARAALEANGYDVLDAIVWLERAGKAASRTASYTTSDASANAQAASAMSQAQSDYEAASKPSSFEDTCRRLWAWLKRVLKRGMEITFVATRRGRQVLSIPLLLLVILAVFAFWILIPLVIVSLFFDVRYHFEGISTVTVDVNEGLGKMSDGVEQLKRDVMDGHADATRGDGADKR